MRTLFLTVILIFIYTGCATWKGVKQDSSEAWEATKDTSVKVYDKTKKAIHNATE